MSISEKKTNNKLIISGICFLVAFFTAVVAYLIDGAILYLVWDEYLEMLLILGLSLSVIIARRPNIATAVFAWLYSARGTYYFYLNLQQQFDILKSGYYYDADYSFYIMCRTMFVISIGLLALSFGLFGLAVITKRFISNKFTDVLGVFPGVIMLLRVLVYITAQVLYISNDIVNYEATFSFRWIIRIFWCFYALVMCIGVFTFDIFTTSKKMKPVASATNTGNSAPAYAAPVANTATTNVPPRVVNSAPVNNTVVNNVPQRPVTNTPVNNVPQRPIANTSAGNVPPRPVTNTPPRPAPVANTAAESPEVKKLRELKKLLDDGIITEDDYNEKKRQILEKM